MSNITDKFKDITRYDIGVFLNSYVYFVDNYLRSITNYYLGEAINKNAFNYLDSLLTETKKIDGLWALYSHVFSLQDFWELLENYELIKIKLQTTSNLGRWMRSSRTDRFSSNKVFAYVQKQGESVERITQNFGSLDKDNDWVQISIDNDLNEEKYTSAGGVILQVRLLNASNFQLKNIVDFMTTENMYGKDIKKKLTLSNGDLLTLSGIDSLSQTFETIMLTDKGSIPEFPEDGNGNDLVGSNTNVFNYPSIFRNFLSMFQKDERFSQFELIDLVKQDDCIFMKLQVKTKIGTILQKNVLV